MSINNNKRNLDELSRFTAIQGGKLIELPAE
jgi:hypothetical protein